MRHRSAIEYINYVAPIRCTPSTSRGCLDEKQRLRKPMVDRCMTTPDRSVSEGRRRDLLEKNLSPNACIAKLLGERSQTRRRRSLVLTHMSVGGDSGRLPGPHPPEARPPETCLFTR